MRYLKKSILVNVALIGLAMVVSYNAARMVRNAIVLRAQSADMTKKIEELRLKKQELEAELVQIQTKEATEREAKERLNMKKSGEEVVVVVPEKKDNIVTASPSAIWNTMREKITSFFQ